ncbi:hypothetical protein SELMODRAFT_425677 [Selaginella moellendorffii]|uniref:Uncharacterized protein n=1 Tax=Selaginella moellendorffii TaxID=88036 RepID=D8STX6_SELML|nr:hypothetical protein SELMODRAFT_425677 [Selaginella moellendorffii]
MKANRPWEFYESREKYGQGFKTRLFGHPTVVGHRRHILMAFLGPDTSEVKKALFSVVFNLFLSIQDEEEEKELLAPFEDAQLSRDISAVGGTQADTVEGFTVPKDWRFHWSIFQSNKRSAFFMDPDKFDLE